MIWTIIACTGFVILTFYFDAQRFVDDLTRARAWLAKQFAGRRRGYTVGELIIVIGFIGSVIASIVITILIIMALAKYVSS